MKTIKELREETTSELNKILEQLMKDSFKLRIQRANGALQQTHHFRNIRRSVARVLTVLNEKKKRGES
ncbi:MAG: 50S ribosomal protein L29 [Gammaproteobacteria bacterium]